MEDFPSERREGAAWAVAEWAPLPISDDSQMRGWGCQGREAPPLPRALAPLGACTAGTVSWSCGGERCGEEVGACLAADAYQTTGKCQCLPGHLSPSAWLLSAFCLPQKGPAIVCSARARSLAGRGRHRPILPLSVPGSSPAPALLASCQVHEKYAVGRHSWVCGFVAGRDGEKGWWRRAVFLFFCLVCLLKWDLRPSPCPAAFLRPHFHSHKRSPCRPTLRPLGLSAHRPPRAR